MTDVKIIDARGLSCPQPLMLTRKALKQQKQGTFEVLVDSGTARENIIRTASSLGWTVRQENLTDGSCKLLITK